MKVTIEKGPRNFQPTAGNPFLPLDWRSLDARSLANGEAVEWSDTDESVRDYAKYFQVVASTDAGRGKAGRRSRWAAIVAAQEIAEHDGPIQWEIRARLLAGEGDEQIAARLELSPKTIDRYEVLFFNVRPRLRATFYLMSHAVGDGVYRGFEDDEVANFWAWVAIGSGLLAVDTMIQAFHKAWPPNEPATLSVYLQANAGIAPGIQAFVASVILPSFGPSGKAIMEIRQLLWEADKATDLDRRALLRERARDQLIRSAQAYLAEKPMPRTRRRPQASKTQNGSPTKAGADLHEAALKAELREVLSHTIGVDPRMVDTMVNGLFVPPRPTDPGATDPGKE